MIAIGVGAFIGVPAALFLSLLPIWSHVYDFAPTNYFMTVFAPAVAELDVRDRLGRLPLKHFMTAMAMLTALVFASGLAVVFFRRTRKHLLMRWISHTGVWLSWAIVFGFFVFLWFYFFYDWSVFSFALSHTRGRSLGMTFYLALGLPIVAFYGAYLSVMVILGTLRDWLRASRRVR